MSEPAPRPEERTLTSLMLAVLILCFVPEISTYLPNLVMGPDGGR